MRFAALAAAMLVATPVWAADNQIRIYFGGAFGGSTTVVDEDRGADKAHKAFGASLVTLGNIFGIEADIADSPGFFENGDSAGLVLSSRVTTVSGDLVIAAPRSRTEYGLRPYVVAGAGLMRYRIVDAFGVFDRTRLLPAFNVGGGAVGFLTNRTGVAWELRRFQNMFGSEQPGFTIGKEKLSFWRASMAFVYRY